MTGQAEKSYLQATCSMQRLVTGICKNSQNITVKIMNNLIRNLAKHMNRYLTNTDILMVRKHIKKRSAPLTITDMQTKTKMYNK